MPPIVLLFLAILTPFMLLTALLLPVYLAMLGASYIIYYPSTGAHPLSGQYLDIFTIINVYQKLFAYWQQHMSDVNLMDYTLPLIGLPLAAILLTYFIMRRLLRWLGDVFHITVGSN